MTRLPIDQIGYEQKFYPRVNGKEDWYTVHIYKSALIAEPTLAFGWTEDNPRRGFPPVVVVRSPGRKWPYLLLDGLHRLRTYHGCNYTEVPAIVERLPESKWLARSAELNIIGKRGLDAGDKAFIAQQLESDGWVIDDVAKLLQMPIDALEKIKAMRIVKIKGGAFKKIPAGRSNREIDGKHYGFLKSPFKDFVGSATAIDVLTAQAPVASMNVLNILDSAIAALECGLDLTNEDVAQRVERIRELLPVAV